MYLQFSMPKMYKVMKYIIIRKKQTKGESNALVAVVSIHYGVVLKVSTDVTCVPI